MVPGRPGRTATRRSTRRSPGRSRTTRAQSSTVERRRSNDLRSFRKTYRYSRTGSVWSMPAASIAIAVGIRTGSSQPASPETTLSIDDAALRQVDRRGPGSRPASAPAASLETTPQPATSERGQEQSGEADPTGGHRREGYHRPTDGPSVLGAPIGAVRPRQRSRARRFASRRRAMVSGASVAGGVAGVAVGAGAAGPVTAGPGAGLTAPLAAGLAGITVVAGATAPVAVAGASGGVARMAARDGGAARALTSREQALTRRGPGRGRRRVAGRLPPSQPRAAASSRRPIDTRRNAMSRGQSRSAISRRSGQRSV